MTYWLRHVALNFDEKVQNKQCSAMLMFRDASVC